MDMVGILWNISNKYIANNTIQFILYFVVPKIVDLTRRD